GPLTASDLTPKDFYEAMTLLPHLPPAEVKAILKQPLATIETRLPDIICFSIIDWSFRFQRPQQLMAQFARRGHRVFYLNVSEFRVPLARPKFSAEPIQYDLGPSAEGQKGKLYDVKVASHYLLDLYDRVVDKREAKTALASLDDLRKAYNINE